MYSEKMIKSLEISKKIVDNLSFAELDDMMSEFDNFVVETNCDWFYNNVTFNDFLHDMRNAAVVNVKSCEILKFNFYNSIYYLAVKLLLAGIHSLCVKM